MFRSTVSAPASLLVVFLVLSCSMAQESGGARAPLPDCEWCGTTEAPAELDWQTRIAGPDEPGEPMVLEGTVYRVKGGKRSPLEDVVINVDKMRTPVAGVIVYAYHTNAEGIYPKRGDETGNARRHGYLRGWVRTGEDGRYRFTTIRPASYPSRSEPAHVHLVVQEPGEEEYWIESVMFEGDPLLTPRMRTREGGRGGPGVITLTRGDDGVWRGRRDILLEAR